MKMNLNGISRNELTFSNEIVQGVTTREDLKQHLLDCYYALRRLLLECKRGFNANEVGDLAWLYWEGLSELTKLVLGLASSGSKADIEGCIDGPHRVTLFQLGLQQLIPWLNSFADVAKSSVMGTKAMKKTNRPVVLFPAMLRRYIYQAYPKVEKHFTELRRRLAKGNLINANQLDRDVQSLFSDLGLVKTMVQNSLLTITQPSVKHAMYCTCCKKCFLQGSYQDHVCPTISEGQSMETRQFVPCLSNCEKWVVGVLNDAIEKLDELQLAFYRDFLNSRTQFAGQGFSSFLTAGGGAGKTFVVELIVKQLLTEDPSNIIVTVQTHTTMGNLSCARTFNSAFGYGIEGADFGTDAYNVVMTERLRKEGKEWNKLMSPEDFWKRHIGSVTDDKSLSMITMLQAATYIICDEFQTQTELSYELFLLLIKYARQVFNASDDGGLGTSPTAGMILLLNGDIFQDGRKYLVVCQSNLNGGIPQEMKAGFFFCSKEAVGMRVFYLQHSNHRLGAGRAALCNRSRYPPDGLQDDIRLLEDATNPLHNSQEMALVRWAEYRMITEPQSLYGQKNLLRLNGQQFLVPEQLKQVKDFGDEKIGAEGGLLEEQYFQHISTLESGEDVTIIGSVKAFRKWYDKGRKKLHEKQTNASADILSQDNVAVFARTNDKATLETVCGTSAAIRVKDGHHEANDDATSFAGGLQSSLTLYVGQTVTLNTSIPLENLLKGVVLRVKSFDIPNEEVSVVLERDAANPSARTFVIKPVTVTVTENAVPSVGSTLEKTGHYTQPSLITKTMREANAASKYGPAFFGFSRRQYPFSTKSVLMVMSTRGMTIEGGVIGVLNMHNDSALVQIGRSNNFVFSFPPKSHVVWDKLRHIGTSSTQPHVG
jgi:hypothetical protein